MFPLRGFNQALRGAFQCPSASTPASRRMCTTAAAAGAAAAGAGGNAFLGGLTKTIALRVGSAMLVGGGACVAWSQQSQPDDDGSMQPHTSALPWVQELAERDSMQEVLSPGQMLRQNPVGKLLTDPDHLFETMIQSGQIVELRCFYDKESKQFHSVVQLGRDVCGFPQTVHGGLTAAIMDETFGGLGVCLWRSGALGFRPPAYTARLEVDYKRKIPAGSVVMCSTELEKIDDRKIWMTSTVTNGTGVVYASARALFVAPRLHKVLLGWIPGYDRS